jgi:hypothetical protein
MCSRSASTVACLGPFTRFATRFLSLDCLGLSFLLMASASRAITKSMSLSSSLSSPVLRWALSRRLPAALRISSLVLDHVSLRSCVPSYCCASRASSPQTPKTSTSKNTLPRGTQKHQTIYIPPHQLTHTHKIDGSDHVAIHT